MFNNDANPSVTNSKAVYQDAILEKGVVICPRKTYGLTVTDVILPLLIPGVNSGNDATSAKRATNFVQ